jgi:hypothetical protein
VRYLFVFLAGSAIYCAVLLAPAASHAAEAWSLQTTPNPSGAQDSTLADVACEPSSTNACTAVGQSLATGTMTPVIERWNGTAWSLQTAALPSGTTQSGLYGVSCPLTTSCIAAGSYHTSSGTRGLAQTWNGSSWAAQPTPNPSGTTYSQLKDIWCTSTSACTAVGWAVIASVETPVAVRWNGAAWSLQAVPVPSGSIRTELDGITCQGASFCVAVGRYTDGGGRTRALSAAWNGTAWSLKTITEPVGADHSALLDVSCTASTACTAVGGWKDTGGYQFTFVQRWNGTSWSLQSSQNMPNSLANVLQSVSCTSATACTAVGSWISSTGGSNKTLAQTWNGSQWLVETTVDPAGATFSAFFGLSCRSSSQACLAVGYSTSSGTETTLGEVRQSSSAGWKVDAFAVPSTAVYTELNDLSCWTSPSIGCTAVGERGQFGAEEAAAYHWNGTTWSNSPTPNLPYDELHGVSCRSDVFCAAVGTRDLGKTLAEHWNGSAWTTQASPNPGGGDDDTSMHNVSCTATNACTAVGYAYDDVANWTTTFAMRWNGTTWSAQTTPNPADGWNHLRGVYCRSTPMCIAVGNKRHSGVATTLAMRWNGTAWTTQSTPTPAGATWVQANAVSCSSDTACTAVGAYQVGTAEPQPFAMRWNGTSWSLQTLALPGGANGGTLEGVSCWGATSCTAVGKYVVGINEYTLAVQWDGTAWTPQQPPNPGLYGSRLDDVVCSTTSALCKAVGWYLDGSGAGHALAMQYDG